MTGAPKNDIPIIVTDESKRKKRAKSDRAVKEPKNVFSDATAKRLLRWIRGTSTLPDTINLPAANFPAAGLDGRLNGTRHEIISPQKDVQEELAEAVRERLFPWLLSLSIHAILLICFALLFFPLPEVNPFDLIMSGVDEELAEVVLDSPIGPEQNDETEVIITRQDLPEVDNPKVDPPEPETVETGMEFASETKSEAPSGIKFAGRDFDNRANMLAAGGGTGKTDAAVVAGLRWLMKVQQLDGSWWFSRPYPNAALRERENRIAATAMALLAFQGYGVTPNAERKELAEFAKSVRMGLDWLLRQQNLEADDRASGDGVFFRDGAMNNDDRFYTHGLCTIALCEVLAMTGDEQYREPARRAVAYCLRHQSVAGGWRYNADRQSRQSDVSVTGWIVMALKSAEAAGIAVPTDCYDNVMKFLDTVATDGGSQYIYRPEEPGFSIAITAEGLLCRELLGWKRDDPRLRRGIELLVDPQYQPSFESRYTRNAYYWYYATQALHHYGGEPWRIWNEKMRELLPQHQEQRGANAGSWNPQLPVYDTWGHQYGRLYTTCLSLYILEVYYRHLSVYGQED